jgi:hypothetical protein
MATSVYGMEPTRSAFSTSLKTSITAFFITLGIIYVTHRVFIMNRGSDIPGKLFSYLKQTGRSLIAEFQRPELLESRFDFAFSSRAVPAQTHDVEYLAIREPNLHTARQNHNASRAIQHRWICVGLNFLP